MYKSDKLIRYLYKNGAKDTFVHVNQFIKTWADEEITNIFSRLVQEDKIKVEDGDYKSSTPDNRLPKWFKMSRVHLTENGVKYYKSDIRDYRIKRFAIYVGAILSVVDLIAILLLHFSQEEHLKSLELQINSIQQTETIYNYEVKEKTESSNILIDEKTTLINKDTAGNGK